VKVVILVSLEHGVIHIWFKIWCNQPPIENNPKKNLHVSTLKASNTNSTNSMNFQPPPSLPSLGYFVVPVKSICSKKCARPGRSFLKVLWVTLMFGNSKGAPLSNYPFHKEIPSNPNQQLTTSWVRNKNGPMLGDSFMRTVDGLQILQHTDLTMIFN